MNDETKKKLRRAGLIGAGTLAGTAAMALSSPFVRREIANAIKTRGAVHAADFAKSIPRGAQDDAAKVMQALSSAGIDLSKSKVAVTGAGGTGKTTFSKALAQHVPNAQTSTRGVHVHGQGAKHVALDHEIKRTAFGWDFSKYRPKAGTISEQTHLLAQSDPDNYDVLIHLEKPVDTVKKQLLKRGKGATQYEIENYELLQKNLRNAFDLTDGEAIQVAPHIRIKVKPKEGFNADKNLSRELKKKGIDLPSSASRGDKVLSVTTGKKKKYHGIPSYLRKDRPAYLAIGGAFGGAAGGGASTYGEKKAAARETHRKVTVGGKSFMLDKEIPLITDLPSDPKQMREALESHIRKAKSSRWSHAQVAIPRSVDISKLKGAVKTRLAIPLPDEALGAISTRAGKMHLHSLDPVHLVHLDDHAPTKNPLEALSHIPESIRAVVKRAKGVDPFVKEVPKDKLKVLYIDETGAGHRAQAKNVVRAAQKMGIEAEAVDFTDTFLKNKKLGKEYRNAYLNFLEKKKVSTVPRLLRAHLSYHGGVDPKKRAKFLKDNKDSAILLAHPHLEGQFKDLKRTVSVMHTDPVKWPVSFSPSAKGKRIHIGSSGVVGDMRTPHKKEVSGLAVSQDLLKKRMSRSGLMNKKKFNVTVSAGGEALEVPEIVEQVLKSDLPDNAEIHAVAGRSKAVLKKLQRIAKKDPRLKAHGFAPLPKMMREADLNVIRAHGTSYAETLTSGKPAVYYGPSLDMVDLQGTLTRRTAVHGGKKTTYPVAVGLDNISSAVNDARSRYSALRQRAKKLQKEYGDPASQIAATAIKEGSAQSGSGTAPSAKDVGLIAAGGLFAPAAVNAGSLVGMSPWLMGKSSLSKEELQDIAKSHGILGIRDKKLDIPVNPAAYDPNTNELVGDLDRYTKAVLYHEIGHGTDKGLIKRKIGAPKNLKSTLAMLRNEAVANINALKLRPGVAGKIDQAIFTLPQMGTYIGAAGAQHPFISTGLAAGALYGGRALKKRRDRKRKEAQSTKTARAPRDYSREYAQYHSKPEQVANRSMRNQARRKLGLKKGDPREADHKTPLSKGGGNGRQNLQAVGRSMNRKKFTKSASYGEKKAAIKQELTDRQKENLTMAAPGAAGVGTAGALMSGIPQKAVGRTGLATVKAYGGDMSAEEMKQLADQYGIEVVKGKKSSANKTKNRIQLGGGTGNRATFFHELGHIQDPGLIDRSNLEKGSVKHTLATLRNEAVANLRGVQKGGIKQIPHALGAQATYLASAAARHKRGLAGLAAGTGLLGTGAILGKNIHRDKDKK